jgi:hypothetical protein
MIDFSNNLLGISFNQLFLGDYQGKVVINDQGVRIVTFPEKD